MRVIGQFPQICDRLVLGQSRPEFVLDENVSCPRLIQAPHIGPRVAFLLLSAKPESWQLRNNHPEELHHTGLRGFARLQDECKRLGSDVLVFLRPPLLHDVAENCSHVFVLNEKLGDRRLAGTHPFQERHSGRAKPIAAKSAWG